MQDCLVLDASYRPIGFCHWQSAIKMVYEYIADVVKEDQSGRKLHSPSISVPFPRVIRVRNYVAKKLGKSLSPNKTNVALRDNQECQYCGVYCNESEKTLDHIMPKSRGGKNTWQNLVLACKICNRFKGDRTPEEAGMKLLSEPVQPKFISYTTNKVRPEWVDYKGMGLF